MNFYILTSKKNIFSSKKWVKNSLVFSFIIFALIVVINYIVDPYSITNHNLLNIKQKFTGDDRAEKVNHFSSMEKVDNILLGSSRVYYINPTVVTDIIGGSTYNFGVGSATIEDILGIAKYLQRNNKLPKNLIVGIDFYTFNQGILPNSYFLKNKKLNFLSYKQYNDTYIDKFVSLDAFKASIKTLKVHLLKKDRKQRFNFLGWGSRYDDYNKVKIDYDFIKVKKEIDDNKVFFYSNNKYSKIDVKRVLYMEELRSIAKLNNVKLYIFNTPLHPLLLKKIESNDNLKLAKKEFIDYLSTFENFTNLYHDKDIYSDLRNFHGATHISANAGDLILQKVLKKN
ncbi:MAG: hypothetical protein L3J19_06705 [Sulfurimonas sp.]|nr:hypothetical protein [Sulfurimonas sp.]